MKKLSDFWRGTLSNTLGTVIGIVLTFGTTLCLQRCEQKKTERTAALMVIHNLDSFCDNLEDEIENLKKADSVNLVVWSHRSDIQTVAADTLQLFLNNLMNRNYTCDDNMVESVFGSNIETWTNIGNSEFIEIAGKCYATRHLANQMRQEMDEEKKQLYYTCMTVFAYSERPTQTLQETIERILRTPEFCYFINKQHHIYIPAMQASLTLIREHNEKNKQLMRVSDDELKQFGFQGDAPSEDTPSEEEPE